MYRKLKNGSKVLAFSSVLLVGTGVYGLNKDKPCVKDTFTPSFRFPEFVLNSARVVNFTISTFVSKMYLTVLNEFNCDGEDKLNGYVRYRRKNQALITVSNHTSTVDDPSILACLLPWQLSLFPSMSRWSLCSQEYCYERGELISTFFFAGKTLPIQRGAGIDQRFLNEFFQKVEAGDWVHIFPEGKIDQRKGMQGREEPGKSEIGRLKWGVGKLVARASIPPIVVPIYHVGMDTVMPQNKKQKLKSMLPKTGKKLYAIVGDPIPMHDLLQEFQQLQQSTSWTSNDAERLIYSKITRRIEDALLNLEKQANAKVDQLQFKDLQEAASRHAQRIQ